MTQRRIAMSYRVAVALGVAWMAISCGGNGASNNDQGMSVTFLGLFGSTSLATNTNQSGTAGISLGQLGCGQLPTGSTGGYIVLGDVGSQPVVTVSADSPNGIDPAGNYLSVIGVQNNLYGQAFRVETVEIEYYIPGASIQPPSATVPAFLIAGPAESASRITTTGGGSQGSAADPGLRRPVFTSLPPSFSNLCNRALAQVTIVPRSVIDWLSVNRGSLPAAPYALQAIIRLSGQSSAGDRIDTNEGLFELNVLPDDYVVPVTTATPEATTTATITEDSLQEGAGDLDDLGVSE